MSGRDESHILKPLFNRGARYKRTLGTLAIGALGAAMAWGANMPMGFLIGPALLVSIVSLQGVKTEVAPPLQNVMFIIIGLTVGSMVTPTSIDTVIRWPIAFALLCVMTIATPYVGQWFLVKKMGFDKHEAFLSATPGHLSFVVSLSESLGISPMRPALLASVRLLSLSLFPPIIARLWGVELGPGLPLERMTADWPSLAIQLACAIIMIPILKRLRLPAPVLLAPMICAAAFHLSGFATGSLPVWLSQVSLVAMGSLIGTRFNAVTWRDLRHNLKAAVGILLLTVSFAVCAALPASYFSGIALMDILIGFAPGGLETMLIVGLAAGADPSFVTTAHVIRLFVLAIVISTYAASMSRK